MEDEVKETAQVATPQTAFDRIRSMVEQPDFTVPKIKTLQDVMLETPMPVDADIAHDMVERARIREDAGE